MHRGGQSIMETAILILVIVAALFAMQVYLKRSLQGRLQSASTSIGEQYDPLNSTSWSSVEHTSNVLTTTTTLAPMVVDRHSTIGFATLDWQETVSPTETNVVTLYDITNRTGGEVVGNIF